MNRIWRVVAGTLVALGLMAGPAAAEVMTDISASELVALMKGQGFGAEASIASDGTPLIVARLGQVKFGVTTYGCAKKGGIKEARCSRLQFVTVFDLSGAPSMQAVLAMNAYNNKRLFGRAYIDQQGDAILDMTINLNRGVTEDNLIDNMTVWTGVVSDFMSDFGWETGA